MWAQCQVHIRVLNDNSNNKNNKSKWHPYILCVKNINMCLNNYMAYMANWHKTRREREKRKEKERKWVQILHRKIKLDIEIL